MLITLVDQMKSGLVSSRADTVCLFVCVCSDLYMQDHNTHGRYAFEKIRVWMSLTKSQSAREKFGLMQSKFQVLTILFVRCVTP